MGHSDRMGIKFRGMAQKRKFEELAAREMLPSLYADDWAMTALGLRQSVLFLLNQIGWETSPILRHFTTYRRLTLEFLSSLIYLPSHGKGISRGFIQFRMFNMEELEHFWGKLTGNDEPEEHEFLSGNIHNPAFRYFHKILTHTLFGKKPNSTSVSRDELFIIFCASQNRPVNGATFMLANLDHLIQDERAPIRIGGLITMIGNAIGLRQPMLDLSPFCGITTMSIPFLFNTMFIANIGSDEFELIIDNQVLCLFTMPDPRTSVHNQRNWLYNLNETPTPAGSTESIQDYEICDDYEHYVDHISLAESDPQTPSGYYDIDPPPQPVLTEESAMPDLRHHMPGTDIKTIIEALMSEQDALREDFHNLRLEILEYMSSTASQLRMLRHHANSFTPPARDPKIDGI
ncbi:hypothetical protein KIW84_044621 [Lathyrus oleraceus]|uniref:Arabidopsis retrotransposon Orf1 C-terminal domain-containing protein n=1 Tax=Pisum sativum TaxID=3888 RepID=A0A9D4XLH6_PEA|nr:hypothetical protein KIW84_044621 [Pisum sativum]